LRSKSCSVCRKNCHFHCEFGQEKVAADPLESLPKKSNIHPSGVAHQHSSSIAMDNKLPPRTSAPPGVGETNLASPSKSSPEKKVLDRLEKFGISDVPSPPASATTPTNSQSGKKSPHVRDQTPPSARLETIDFVSSPSKKAAGTPPRPNSQTGLEVQPPSSDEPSVPPPRHFDLTPVTRNTSEVAGLDFDDAQDDQDLIGEHLAMPSDLGAGADGHLLPQPSSLSSHHGQRAKSVGHFDLSQMVNQSGLQRSTQLDPKTSLPPPRTGFNADYRHFSFTSRNEQAAAAAEASDAPQEFLHHQLTPYTPTREELMDIGLNEAQVDKIFTQRRRSSLDSSTSLSKPIPLDDRQLSIPSLRMAHRVYGSKTSLTDYTGAEDEDTIFRDDDASLSSRGSLYLIDHPFELGNGESLLDAPLGQAPILLNGLDQIQRESSSLGESSDDPTTNALNGEGIDFAEAKERRALREQNAVEWLRAVQSTSQDVFAEAASSKFLTGQPQRVQAPSPKSITQYSSLDSENTASVESAPTTQIPPPSSAPKIIQRQTSSPATLDAA
jgi:hypothetical protein